MKEAELDTVLDELILPYRFEILEREVHEQGLDINQIVKKVDDANDEINILLKQIKSGKIGKFKIFYGSTGSGKTTFLKTFPEFYTNVEVTPIGSDIPLIEIISFIEGNNSTNQDIYVLEDRDNPNESSEDLKIFFETLRAFFRKKEGEVLIIWPITDKGSVDLISSIVWNVGGDSLTSHDGAIYKFQGLDKELYFETANITAKNLNERSLEEYGITKDTCIPLIEDSETIGLFFSKLQSLSLEINKETRSFLKEKVTPKIWILLPGDEATEIDRTVSSLTHGVSNEIDVGRFLSLIDDTSNPSAYLNDWRLRRDRVAYLLRLLDLRLFPIYPNLSTACVRAFGADEIKTKLKKKTEKPENAIKLVKESSFYQLIFGDLTSPAKSPTKTSTKQSNEYKRIQILSGEKDKLINKALGQGILEALKSESNLSITVDVEKQGVEGLNLRPDILVKTKSGEVICLEPTWRTTGAEITGEIEKKSNTLTRGNIQKYILDKAIEYVKELGY